MTEGDKYVEKLLNDMMVSPQPGDESIMELAFQVNDEIKAALILLTSSSKPKPHRQ